MQSRYAIETSSRSIHHSILHPFAFLLCPVRPAVSAGRAGVQLELSLLVKKGVLLHVGLVLSLLPLSAMFACQDRSTAPTGLQRLASLSKAAPVTVPCRLQDILAVPRRLLPRLSVHLRLCLRSLCRMRLLYMLHGLRFSLRRPFS